MSGRGKVHQVLARVSPRLAGGFGDELADEIFTIRMGDRVEPRKDFIVKHALEERNIDI